MIGRSKRRIYGAAMVSCCHLYTSGVPAQTVPGNTAIDGVTLVQDLSDCADSVDTDPTLDAVLKPLQ